MKPWPEAETSVTALAQWYESLSRAAFDHGMAKIHRAIVDDELYQLNYTVPLYGALQGAPRDLFMALRRALLRQTTRR